MKTIILALVLLLPAAAQAQSLSYYAMELSQPCSMTVYDHAGVPQPNTLEPMGYVVEYQWWQGAVADAAAGIDTLYQATDPCGHSWNPVLVVGGSPIDGFGGVVLP